MHHPRITRGLFPVIALMICLIPMLPAEDEDDEAGRPTPAAGSFGPETPVYCDAMWLRVHAADCPALILKEQKQTMTLDEADKAGYRIGEAGQSGRDRCCLHGYQRKHPERTFTDDTVFAGNHEQKNVKHIPGCHRFWPTQDLLRRTRKDWVADGFTICPHCIERGPNVAILTDDASWAKLPDPQPFVPPEGWVPKRYPVDRLPAPEEIDLLIGELLCSPNGIQELPFADPVARMENFMTMRFFFPVGNWLHFYKAYRSTGDQRLRDKILESARNYHQLIQDFPTVAQAKASDPEGLPFMYSMAVWARITLQLARKHPDQISTEELKEAESFLKAIMSVLKPICEGSEGLDPVMGIPQPLADDFRTRAFNRAMNGIGTLGMTVAALEDLQALNQTREHQPTIDRYRKVIQEYLRYWFSIGDLVTTPEGERHFVYPYAPEANPKVVDGSKIYKRAEDGGHYSHTLHGVLCLYESVPELGIDDDFMTAVANAVYRSSTVQVEVGRGKKRIYSGHIESPTQARIQPTTSDNGKGHQYGAARDRFYMLEAFKAGMIDGLCITLDADQKAAANSDLDRRLATLHAQYLAAFRKDRTLIHLGEKP